MGGLIKSPQPSNKERLARARGVGLFDIAGLATTEYHGGQHGVHELTVLFIHNCGYQSFSNTVSPKDVLICFGEIKQVHSKLLQSWYNPRTLVSGPSVARILDKGFQVFPKLHTLDVQDAVEFYDKFQDLSKDYLLPLMPFDAVQLVNNFEGLFIPGHGTLRYQECASALFELLPWLIPITIPEIHAKLCSVRVKSKNGYDLFWHILELTVPAFDPTVPLEAPGWDHDADIWDFSRRYELYFRLQAKKQVYFNTRNRTTMFLKAIASMTYANIATSLQSNIDSYRHPDNEYFLPQNYHLTNIAMLIHTHTKSQVRDLGLRRVNKVAGWDSMSDVLLDDELHYCHIQGYQPRALRVEQDRGGMGQGGAQNFQRQPRFDNRQDRSTLSMDRSLSTNSTLSSDRSTNASRGRFAWPDQ